MALAATVIAISLVCDYADVVRGLLGERGSAIKTNQHKEKRPNRQAGPFLIFNSTSSY